MNDYGKLAYTGAGTLTIGGVVLNQWGLLGIAVGTIVVGALLVRYAWRRGKTVSSK